LLIVSTTSSMSSPALEHAGDADLIDHLRRLTGARRTEQPALAGVGRDHLASGVEHRAVVAAAHHGELTVLCAGLPA
jgi:hypothetical protein